MKSNRAVLWMIFLLCAAMSFAQTNATISGTVTDPSGAAVPGATVTALNTGTGVPATAESNGAGIYVFPALLPGKYNVSVEHAGFRKSSINAVDVAVAAKLTVNLSLELGQTTETVEVQATAENVNASSATVGNVVEERKILDLPLVGRSAYDLVGTQAGVTINGTSGVNINGAQTGAVNYTTDGINTQDNLLNGASSTNIANTVSVDRVQEFRIVTSPADAEYGRGSGQVQMVTRGGGNQFRGSAWEELRNTDLNANDWFNNAAGVNKITGAMNLPRNVLVRNQFGLRFGGPVKHNKTFFNGIWEEDHENQRVAQNSEVFTPSALAGIYRYFPGVLNGNATSSIPVVNTSGQPIQPASATGPLQSVNIYGRDPNRMVPDPTGTITKYLGIMPAPNNYLVGDGLNTAGYFWARPVIDDFQLFEGRIDHQFNESNRLSLTLNHQSYYSVNVASAQPYPGSPIGLAPTETTQYSAALTSTLRPNLLNEARFGVFRPRTIIWEDIDPNAGPPGVAGQKLLPTANGVPYYLGFITSGLTNPLVNPGGPNGVGSSNRMTQNWQYGDSMTWIKGRHTFKGGIEMRRIGNEGYDTGGVTPVSTGGAGAVAVQGFTALPGIGSNLAGAQNLLTDLSGSMASITQALNSPGGPNPTFVPGESRYSDLHTPEYGAFFKDDFKLTPSFTLNLGVRYDFYGVPTDLDGRAAGLVGGTAGSFGISGTTFANGLFQPGVMNGSLTQIQLVGPKTPNPGQQLYQNDSNNFAPFLGFAWSLPGDGALHWLTGGKDKTVIRAGYGMSYQRDSLYLTHMTTSFEPNGLTTSPIEQSTGLLTVGNVSLPIPTTAVPLSLSPLNGPRNAAVYNFNNGLKNGRIQNFNFSLERALSANTQLTLSYVGSIGTGIVRAYDIDEVNVLNNGFLQAFDTVQQGGDSALMDKLVAPLKLTSSTMRSSSLFNSYFANNNPGTLAALLNSALLTGGIGGGLVAAAGLPANFFVANPQFSNSYLVDSSGHSTYHSFQLLVNRRLTKGLTIQGSYVFSKALGDNSAGDSSTFFEDYRTLRDLGLDKQVLGFNHANVIKINGLYELPFGPGKPFLGGNNSILSRIVGGWQTGAIFTWETGSPITLGTSQNGLNTVGVADTATQLGPLPASVTKVGNGVIYFPGTTQINDPSIANITSQANLNKLSTMKAIADANGNPILVNPLPGQLGSTAINSMTGPSIFRIDLNLIKRFKINERFTFQIGASAENLTNTEVFANPGTSGLNIDNAAFGHITSTASGFTPRIIVLQARLDF